MKEFLFRTVFSGAVVAAAVFLSKTLGPLWGGLFGSFPAAFSSMMYLITRAHGIEFASSVARTLPYGSIGNVIFAVSFFFLVPAYGIISGIIFSYFLSIIAAATIYCTILRD